MEAIRDIPPEYSQLKETWLSLLKEDKLKEAEELYFSKMLDFLLPIINRRLEKPPSYDGIISLLGFTPETSVITYKVLHPK